MSELNRAAREEVAEVLAERVADVVKHYENVRESMETRIGNGHYVPVVLEVANRQQKHATVRFMELLEVAKALDVIGVSAWHKAENERNIKLARLNHAYRTHEDSWEWSQEFAHEEKIINMLNEADMNGDADVTMGSVQYGSGYHVFHEVGGHHLVMMVNSQGNKYATEVTEQESAEWQADLEAEYAEYDD